MFQFIEFSDFSSQINSLFTNVDLKPLKDFFKCLELAEDSHLIMPRKKTAHIEHELRTALKQDENSHTGIVRMSTYRTALTSTLQLQVDTARTKEHQQRKELIRQLTFSKGQSLKDRIERSKDQIELSRKLQTLAHLARDPSLHFESYNSRSLIDLKAIIKEMPNLVQHILLLKKSIAKKAKKSSLSIYPTGILYLEELEKQLSQVKESWCENLLDRLEKASSNQDIYYSDNLFRIIEEINNHLRSTKDKIAYPKHPRRDLDKISFSEAQNIIRKFGTGNQIARLNQLSWNKPNDEFIRLAVPQQGIQSVPHSLFQFIVKGINWLWHFLFSSYRYRSNFLRNYAHLIAQQKLLSEQKITQLFRGQLLTQHSELTRIKTLENEIKKAVSELSTELQSETVKLMKSNPKLLLILNYRNSLNHSLELIVEKKIEILKEQAELLKIYVFIPDLVNLNESLNFTLYHTAPIKKAILALHQEVVDALNTIGREVAYSLGIKFRSADLILREFYKIETESSEIEPPHYEASELERLAKTSLACLFLMSQEPLKIKLAYYQAGYQKLSVNSDPLTQRAIEQSLYQFIISYLEFINEHLDELATYDEKLTLIEDSLIAANPIAAGYLRELQHLRTNTTTPHLKQKLQLQARIIMSAVRPEIKKRSLSEVMTRVTETCDADYSEVSAHPAQFSC